MEKTDKAFVFRQLMTYGTIVGVLLVINSLFLSFAGINEFTNTEGSFLTNLKPLIIGLGIYFSLKHYSSKILGEQLKFGKFVLYGVVIGVFFSVIYSVYFVIFVKYIDTTTISALKDLIIKQYESMELPQNQISIAIDLMTKPIFLFFSYFISNIFMAAIFSVMFAVFNLILPKPKKR